MFTVAERMRAPLEHFERAKHQLDALLEVDRYFERYDLEFDAPDASGAAHALGRAEIAAFISGVNHLLPCFGPRGRSLHRIHIGKFYGAQVVVIGLFRGVFPDTSAIEEEVQEMAMAHGAIRTGSEEGRHGLEIWARWEAGKK